MPKAGANLGQEIEYCEFKLNLGEAKNRVGMFCILEEKVTHEM